MRGAVELAALYAAMENTPPLCRNVDLFTSDERTELETASCVAICNECPLKKLCAEAARASRVNCGVWGGKVRGIQTTTPNEREK
jgi:hypothetical protein